MPSLHTRLTFLLICVPQALPSTYQCYDWQLVYRLAEDGANVSTLVHKGRGHSTCLLVVRDTQGAVFGALLTEQLRMGERERYYGHGTTAVWAFKDGALQVSQLPTMNALCLPVCVCTGMASLLAVHRINLCSSTPGASRTATSSSAPRRASRWAAEATSPSTW